MAKEIKPENASGAARFLRGLESMRRVEHHGVTGLVNTNRLAELQASAEAEAGGVPRPHEKVKREFVLTRETEEQLEGIVRFLRQSTNAKLSGSHVLRALLRLLARHQHQLRAAAASHGPRRLPSTGRSQADARVEFEVFLASIFQLALRSDSANVAPEVVEGSDKLNRS